LEQLAVVEERQRLARDLHDSVTQTLYSVTLYADAAIWSLETGETSTASAHIREVQSSSREALREMRLLIFELHPPELEAEGLAAVLQARLEAVEARAGFKADFRVEGERRLPLAVEEALYRIAQEALNNIFKHACAKQVTVALRFTDGEVALTVSDDGIGFDPAALPSPGGLGLRNMEERARKLRGTLQVDSAPGKGTRVCVVVKTHDMPR
jgi:signal transduction histidine kinase